MIKTNKRHACVNINIEEERKWGVNDVEDGGPEEKLLFLLLQYRITGSYWVAGKQAREGGRGRVYTKLLSLSDSTKEARREDTSHSV